MADMYEFLHFMSFDNEKKYFRILGRRSVFFSFFLLKMQISGSFNSHF